MINPHRNFVRIGLLYLCFSLSPFSTYGAPYCLSIPGVPPQCIYFDTHDCFREAGKQRGNCSLNAAEVTLPAYGSGRFCMVLNGPVIDCSYVDRRSCDDQAIGRSGICIDRTPSQPDVDLFRR
jgi:hypothetical protein